MTGINLPAGIAKGPAWSADGRWIVFSLARPESAEVAQVGVAHIYRARPDGTHLAQVSNTPNSDFLVSLGRPPRRMTVPGHAWLARCAGRRAERFSAYSCRLKERRSGFGPSGSMNREVKHGKRSPSATQPLERPSDSELTSVLAG